MNVNFLKKIAPFIATGLSLTGPVGAMAGNALNMALGLKPNAGATEQEAALAKATPEQFAALKKQEDDFQLQMKAMDIQSVNDLEKIAADDRNSAREREKAVKDRTPENGFYMLTLGFFGVLACTAFHKIPNESRDLVNILLGSLGTAWVASVNYFYGSSRSSDSKTQALADIAKMP